jgi:hypothetical protein
MKSKKSFQIWKAFTNDQIYIEKVIPDLEGLLQSIKMKSKKSFQIWKAFTNDQLIIIF